ncbi:MAG: EAL domain-containing protein [Proteobacteria bacterium]|nr:EAL domain-containing protein [Pseudomonadota bacterium]MBU4009140.1 EAL domain-containing protein [Pseudomonadota bacterium]
MESTYFSNRSENINNQTTGQNEIKQVLVVDDDTTIRLLARETLEEAGFIVTEAADGAQGFAVFESVKPQVVLLDVMLPGMDGFTVCKKIRNHPDGSNIAILMMTGLEGINSIQHAYEAGATDFITKPINWQILGYRTNYMYRANQAFTDLRKSEAQIRSLALYDNLTGLPNRILFRDHLEQAIRQATRQNNNVAVMFIDLDQFKDINDSLGHNAGDKLLREVGQRLLSVTRSSDTVSRLGGDEFTLVLQNTPSLDIICSLAQKIMDTFSEPFVLESKEIFVTASIGVAVYPGDAEKADDLLKHADMAMSFAKEQGKNNYKLFSPDMQIKADTRLSMQNEIRLAMERNEFFLHYQPKFNTMSGELTGMEALIRWNHPEKGVIFPNTFISIAENTGLIVPLGEWVMLEACRQNMAWQALGYEPIQIAVNFSAIQFKRSNLLATIQRVLKNTGMAPYFLQIELTESSLMEQSETIETLRRKEQPIRLAAPSSQKAEEGGSIINTLDILQKMGVSIALDDFGTGYSSLSYLRYFPIDVIKIDRSFVWAINALHGSEIISAIIEMSKKLHLQVTAEGVETEYQKTYLINRGCNELQGFLTGKPASAKDCLKYFTKQQKTVVNE